MNSYKYLLAVLVVTFLVACGGGTSTTPSEPNIEPPQPLSEQQNSTQFTIENTSSSSLSWNISVANDSGNPQSGDWFTVEPDSGTLGGNEQTDITLTLLGGLTAGTYSSTLTVNYTGGSTPFEVTGQVGTASSGSFSLTTDNFSNAVVPGGTVPIPVYIERTGGLDSSVTLELFGAPEGITGSFSPNPVTGDESTLNLQTDGSVPSDDYTFSVRGKGGGVSDTLDIDLSIVGNDTEPSSFRLALSNPSLRITQGNSKTTTVTVKPNGDFDSSVSLSLSGLPGGVTVDFDPDTTSGASELKLTVSSSARAGTYELTVEGDGGGTSTSTMLGLTILSRDTGSAQITGTARTDAYLGDFSVPSSLTGGTVVNRTAREQAARPDYVPGQLLVRYEQSAMLFTQGIESLSREEARVRFVQDVLTQYGLEAIRASGFDEPALVAVSAGENVMEMAARLAADPRVAYAEPNYYIYPMSVPNDPEFDQQYNLAVSGVPVAWDAEDSATNITVAVLDSGFQTSHNDLSGRFVTGYDFCGNSDCSSRDGNVSPDGDNDTHGTHVAGIIAAQGNNSRGIAGVLKGGAKVVPVKVFYNYNFTTAERLAQAIRWAAGVSVSGVPSNSNPADILNLSLGTDADSQTIKDAVTAAQNRGALLIAASGNSGGSVLYPAKYAGVVAVGSVNSNFQRSCFSNSGSEIDVVAAGGDGFPSSISACSGRSKEAVLSTIPNNNYGTLVGTSQAAPLVSGVAALIWSSDSSQSADEVQSALKASAYKTGSMSNNEYGAGVVRADLAFGYPGPGSRVSVTAGTSALDTVTLAADGETERFTLSGLASGSTTVEAEASGDSRSLSASQNVSPGSSESKTVTLKLKP